MMLFLPRPAVALALAFILAFAGGTYLYQHGKHVGALDQRITTDTKTYHTAQQAAQEADVKSHALDGRIALATSHVTQARAKVTRALAPLTLTATSASVNGDTTAAVVIPALVQTIHAYQQLDSAQTSKDTLRGHQVALKDTAITRHQAVDSSAVRVIGDYREAKSPRCSAKCGAVITTAVIVVGVFTAHHFGVHF